MLHGRRSSSVSLSLSFSRSSFLSTVSTNLLVALFVSSPRLCALTPPAVIFLFYPTGETHIGLPPHGTKDIQRTHTRVCVRTQRTGFGDDGVQPDYLSTCTRYCAREFDIYFVRPFITLLASLLDRAVFFERLFDRLVKVSLTPSSLFLASSARPTTYFQYKPRAAWQRLSGEERPR